MTTADSAVDPATDIETFDFWRLERQQRRDGFAWLRQNDPVSWHPPAESRQVLTSALREVYGQLSDFHVGEPEYVFSNFINGVRKVPATWSVK